MTISTNSVGFLVAKIVPVKVVFNDSRLADYLGITLIQDNLSNNCAVNWILIDDNITAYGSGTDNITGSAYTNWDGSNEYLFNYIGTLLGLTFV